MPSERMQGSRAGGVSEWASERVSVFVGRFSVQSLYYVLKLWIIRKIILMLVHAQNIEHAVSLSTREGVTTITKFEAHNTSTW